MQHSAACFHATRTGTPPQQARQGRVGCQHDFVSFTAHLLSVHACLTCRIGISSLLSGWVAARIGLINTMVCASYGGWGRQGQLYRCMYSAATHRSSSFQRTVAGAAVNNCRLWMLHETGCGAMNEACLPRSPSAGVHAPALQRAAAGDAAGAAVGFCACCLKSTYLPRTHRCSPTCPPTLCC